MEEYINKFRFLIPGMIIFLALLFLVNPALFNSFDKHSSTVQLVGSFLLLLTIGFIISSIGYFIVNLFGLTVEEKKRYKWYKPLNKDGLEEIFEKEMDDWESLFTGKENQVKDRYIIGQIDKRWAMFMSNLNMVISTVIAYIFVSKLMLKYQPIYKHHLYSSLFLLLIIFSVNAHRGFCSVHSLTKILRDKKKVEQEALEKSESESDNHEHQNSN